ncbi:glycosyltransferase family 39 protein, partial [Gonapodya prolifera JEL478]
PALLTFLAFLTRMWAISWADFVVWDEAHFGKFASHYIQRQFYFDVHPPLGKILLGFSGVIAGYNGTWDFPSSQTYPRELNYGIMRVFCATFGALMVPLAWYTALEMRMGKRAAFLAAVMVLWDTSYIAITKFILLDSMLLFFTVLSVYCFCCFRNEEERAFTESWWYWLAMTGLSLGCVLSVKWFGLFTIAVVGLATVEDLWRLLGDVRLPVSKYLMHWGARIACLIVLPMVVYMFSFKMHFFILNRSGTGDAQMSSLFQAGLEGIDFDQNPLEVAYGSRVTIKNNGPGGGLLHSHVQKYPKGSEQQQVTCYGHKDSNNDWIIGQNWNLVKKSEMDAGIVYLHDGDVIRLIHDQTSKNLHSHNHKAPITKRDNEVSCYGGKDVGDTNDNWRIEVVSDTYRGVKGRVHALTTTFRIRHVNSGCLLKSHAVTLPEWGFKQAETTCDKSGRENSRNVLWNVERHYNEKLPPGPRSAFRSSFFRDFIDLNVAMWTGNNALTPDPDKEPDAIVSTPPQWPLASVGLRMCGWADDKVKFFLLGNPIVWWGGAFSLVAFMVITGVYALLWQRGLITPSRREVREYMFAGLQISFLGWIFHYCTIYLMGRVTYLHHYFPALYFAILQSAFIFDHVSRRWLRHQILQDVAFVACTAIVWMVGWHFKDFAFGMQGPAKNWASRQWLKSWKFYD